MISCSHREWTKIDSMNDLMYFLGAAELVIVEIFMLISHYSHKASISVLGSYFVQLLVLVLSTVRR